MISLVITGDVVRSTLYDHFTRFPLPQTFESDGYFKMILCLCR